MTLKKTFTIIPCNIFFIVLRLIENPSKSYHWNNVAEHQQKNHFLLLNRILYRFYYFILFFIVLYIHQRKPSRDQLSNGIQHEF